MALKRIEWIAAALNFLADVQSGFRCHRSTADCISDVVTTLLLGYVEEFLGGRTFRVRIGGDLSAPRPSTAGVPQGSILGPMLFNLALARIVDYIPRDLEYEVGIAIYADDIALFASGPTLRGLQVRQSLNRSLEAVDGGTPLARPRPAERDASRMPLEEMVFGEEISRQEDEASGWIVAHSRKKQRQDFTPGDSPGPSAGHRAARPAHPKGPINKLIAASRLPRLPKDHYRVVVRPKGGMDVRKLSTAKTEALLVHPTLKGRYEVGRLKFRGRVLPWRRSVQYLGITIDHRLSWKPAVTSHRLSCRRVAGAASSLLARGKGCSPDIALRMYNAVAGARALYAFSCISLRPNQWETLETAHRGIMRRLFGMPRASPVGVTYAETGQFPLSLRAKACALRHIERMHMTRGGKALVHRLLSLPDTGMGRSALEYASLISGAPFAGLLPIPPHWDSRLPISTRVPGVRSKGNTPRAALLQETCALIEQRYSGHLHVYTDGSVKGDGSAAAASVIPALRDERKCRLPLPATSTTAELAALNLAADQLAELLPSSAVIFCDSRAALLTLARGENGSSIAQRITRKFTVIVRSGCGVSFQWVPSHVGVRGNEEADELARDAHDLSTPTTNFVRDYDVARLIIARHVRALHPDPRTAAGNPVPRLPSTGIGRRARAFLLRLRAGCGRTAQLLSKQRGSGSPSCVQCPAEETVEHIVCQCPGYADIRRRLCNSYRKLGLPHVSAEHLLFPSANVATRRRAFYALLDFFGDANLFTRL
nr:uncharacterized protein LOC119183021 [Rhipicephalus microplus]